MSLWTIAWLKRDEKGLPAGEAQWCATKGNAAPSESALHDSTACGYVVTLRIGSRQGEPPTCPECIATLARKAGDEHMGAFVFCASHLRPHATGWCTVSTTDKIQLAARAGADAEAECRRLGFFRFDFSRDTTTRPDRDAYPLMHPLAEACGGRHYRSWLTPERETRDNYLRALAKIARGGQ